MDFTDLSGYLVWANRRTLEMLRQTPEADAVAVFAHLLAVEAIWADRTLGTDQAIPQRPQWSLEECAAAIPASAAPYAAIARDFGTDHIVAYRNFQGEAFTSPLAEILFHVAAHGAYHRGQIAESVRRAGGSVIDTDYLLYRREMTALAASDSGLKQRNL